MTAAAAAWTPEPLPCMTAAAAAAAAWTPEPLHKALGPSISRHSKAEPVHGALHL